MKLISRTVGTVLVLTAEQCTVLHCSNIGTEDSYLAQGMHMCMRLYMLFCVALALRPSNHNTSA